MVDRGSPSFKWRRLAANSANPLAGIGGSQRAEIVAGPPSSKSNHLDIVAWEAYLFGELNGFQ